MVFQERTYSVLIVTASNSFTDRVMPLLPMTDYWPVSTARSVGEARRKLTDTEFDIVLINTPLPDDFGMGLAIDICSGSGAGVLLLVKSDQYNDVYAKVVGYGVITLSKTTSRQMVAQNLRIQEGFEPSRRFLDAYSLSRGAPSATWVLPQRMKLLAERVGFEPTDAFHIAGFQDRCFRPARPSLRMQKRPCCQMRVIYYHAAQALSTKRTATFLRKI